MGNASVLPLKLLTNLIRFYSLKLKVHHFINRCLGKRYRHARREHGLRLGGLKADGLPKIKIEVGGLHMHPFPPAASIWFEMMKSGGSWTPVKKFDFLGKFPKNFDSFRQFHKKNQFFRANFRKISIFSGDFTKISIFQGKFSKNFDFLGNFTKN